MIDIADYSEGRWSGARIDAYLEAIDAAVRRVADRPGDGRQIDDRLPDLRRIRVESHHVVYRATSDTLTVIAVLHVRMDAVRHLG